MERDAVFSHAKVIVRHFFCCCVLPLLVPGGLTVYFTLEPLINYVAFMKKEMSLFICVCVCVIPRSVQGNKIKNNKEY